MPRTAPSLHTSMMLEDRARARMWAMEVEGHLLAHRQRMVERLLLDRRRPMGEERPQDLMRRMEPVLRDTPNNAEEEETEKEKII